MSEEKPKKPAPLHFLNPFKDFTGRFDSEDYELPSGEKIYLSAALACHFAKHLVNRELHNAGKQVTDPEKHKLVQMISPKLCWHPEKHRVLVASSEQIAMSEAKRAVHIMNVQAAEKDAKAEEAKTEEVVEEPKEEVSDAASEVQPPAPDQDPNSVPNDAPVDTPEDVPAEDTSEGKKEGSVDLSKALRPELEEVAIGLGIDKDAVSNAPNKPAILELIHKKRAELLEG